MFYENSVVIRVTHYAKVMHHCHQRQQIASASGVFIYLNGTFTATIKAQYKSGQEQIHRLYCIRHLCNAEQCRGLKQASLQTQKYIC